MMRRESADMPEIKYHSNLKPQDFSIAMSKERRKTQDSRRMGLRITIADLGFILVFALIFMPLLMRKGAQKQWNGYEWSLRNQTFTGETTIALRVKSMPQGSHLAKKPYQVQFFCDGEALTQQPMQAVFPEEGQEGLTRLNVSALEGKYLKAVITFEGKSTELRNSVSKDPQ